MKITKTLIQRYHAGLCTAEESAAVRDWMETSDAEMSFPDDADFQGMEDKGWRKIAERFHFNPAGSKVKSFAQWQIAAVLLMTLGVALSIYWYKLGSKSGQQIMVQTYKEIKALKGQKLHVTLPDGTLVQLNSESVLRFPLRFGSNSREVSFRGEAFFKVAKDATRPFSIQTGETRVTVLGTRFNLRAYPEEEQTSVVVEEGRVRFSAMKIKDSLILNANQQGIYVLSSKMQLKEVDASRHLAWKDDCLVFEDLRLKEIIITLERWYGVEIALSDKDIAEERYSGRFAKPDLTTVLESLAFALKFEYRLNGKVYEIDSKK